MLTKTARRAAVACFVVCTAAGAASAEPLTPAAIFGHASPFVQAIILGLVAATLAAIVVCIMKLASRSKLAGGSAFISGLRVGGPLAGFLGAAWGGLNMAIGLANLAEPVPVNVLAHGWAEAMFLIVLGLLCGAVAVICHWAIEARIDRAVLRG
jgi:biopolymer transport protein ExbB/TolQ